MPYAIDTTTWAKNTHLPAGVGWSRRPNSVRPTTIVIHTTSAVTPNTAFDAEARYLYNSRDVSAHFLNGKAGQIAQILDPDLEAWHAGVALTAYTNAHSIGIENHVSLGEAWTETQHDSLTWLVRQLMAHYQIGVEQIDTHRAVAIPGPNIRKHDPTGWDNAAFYLWRDTLATITKSYTVKHRYVTQRMEDNGPPYVRELVSGELLSVDKWYANRRVHLADGSGFADLDDLEAL